MRRIDRYDGQRGLYHYRSHKSERVEWARVDVSPLIGRMVPQTFAKGLQRGRYDRVQAAQTFAQLKPMMRTALAKVQGLGKGAIKILAPLTYRQRYPQSTGRDPLRCPRCQNERGASASGIRLIASSAMNSRPSHGENMRRKRHEPISPAALDEPGGPPPEEYL